MITDSKASNEALEMKLLQILKKNPKVTQKELSGMLNVSRATIQRLIKMLEHSKRIERIGGKRYGYWEIQE